jgi:dCMP deaminase
MEMAHVIRKRSTCSRGTVGAVAVMDSRVLATGYNGSPPGAPHCTDVECDVPANNHAAGCQRAIHCEANLIAWAARHGVALRGATLYCTHGPCLKCAQLILSAGFTRVVYGVPYRLSDGIDMLTEEKWGGTGHHPRYDISVEQFDQEYVQLLEIRHVAAPTAAQRPAPTQELPTECQAAEDKYYGGSE